MTTAQPVGFTLSRKLGEGASATVYEARDDRLDRMVALKHISFERFQEDAARRVLIREAQLLARIRNPHVARVYDILVQSDGAWLVMELVRGMDLRSVLASHRVPLGRALYWTLQLAQAVESIAAEGVIHRDIKPANIIMTSGFDVCLVDLGVAIATTAAGRGAVAGTPAYMAPEQILGNAQTPKTDVYACGVVAFELLAGQHPFAEALKRSAVSEAHLHEATPHARSLRSDLPRWADKLIWRAMSKKPQDRPSIREVRQQIQKNLGTRER